MHNEFYNESFLMHYGIKRRSGRYPWGSGEHPFQSAEEFMDYVKNAKEEGLSETEIARALNLSTNAFRDQRTAARNEIRENWRTMGIKLTSMGYSLNGAANRMGVSPSTLSGILSDRNNVREEVNNKVKSEMENMLKQGYLIDVGEGAESHLGISKERLRAMVKSMESSGYKVMAVYQKQVGTHNKTSMKVLCPEDMDLKTLIDSKDKIVPPNFHVDRDTNEIQKPEPPRAFPSERVMIRYAEDGGKDRDGLIQLRKGVPELSLGNARYAQVRISVDGTHYLKGMAMYSDDMPEGVDIIYNVNKHKGTPKMDCMKKMKSDPDSPFGATIRMDDELVLAQRHYTDKDGKRQLSCLNIVSEEGTWFEWSKSLPSQMLSKQRVPVVKRQLDKSYQAAAARVNAMMQIKNPAIRAKVAEDLSGQLDSDATNLRAMAYPRQCAQVILPFPNLSENEIYAPNFKDGERVALIRFPHGGIFEIPQLTVRNHGSPAAKELGNAIDAVGINPRVAEQLSGADFDGDTVLVIPNNEGSIISHPMLKELRDFDPKESYPGKDCDPADLIPNDGPNKKKGDKIKGLEMGRISNLITDMTIMGAPFNEIARAVKHSMVVIDAQKHQLNYKKSYIDNNIGELYIKYHGGEKRGASTIVSRATATARVPERREAKGLYEVPPEKRDDWMQGKRVYVETGGQHWNTSQQKMMPNLDEVAKMDLTDDARTLSSGTEVEEVYADFSNKMKELADTCRRVTRTAPAYRKNPMVADQYRDEVAIIESKVAERKKKSPLERRANILAEADMRLKIQADPSIKDDPDKFKKESNRSLLRARNNLSVGDVDIHLTDKEWNAVFNGALNGDTFLYLMRHCDSMELNQQVFHEKDNIISDQRIVMVKEMDRLGYSRAQIAEHTGLSPRILKEILE